MIVRKSHDEKIKFLRNLAYDVENPKYPAARLESFLVKIPNIHQQQSHYLRKSPPPTNFAKGRRNLTKL